MMQTEGSTIDFQLFLSHFRIGISSPHDYFDVFSNPVIVQRGYKTVVKIKPTTMTSDSNIVNLDIYKRRCVADGEMPNQLKLFKEYSAAACKFECMYKFR